MFSLTSTDAKLLQLKKKVMSEQKQRKKWMNQVIEMKGNIRVFCRVRPLLPCDGADASMQHLSLPPLTNNQLDITQVCDVGACRHTKSVNVTIEL